MLLGNGEFHHLCIGVNIQPQLLKHLLRLTQHFTHILKSEPVQNLTAQEDVFRHSQMRDKHNLLMDDSDSMLPGNLDVIHLHIFSADIDCPPVRPVNSAQNLNQS